MKTMAFRLGIAALFTAGTGCGLFGDKQLSYDYEVDPQELTQDVSQAFSGQTGMFPEVDCTTDSTLCSMIPTKLPPSASVSCDDAMTAGKKHCVAHYDLTIHQSVNLSQQTGLPPEVANAPLIDHVDVDEVRYWAGPKHMLNVATPPLDIFIGGAEAMAPTDAGVEKLGTLGSIPPGVAPSAKPDCTKGAATGKDTACDLQLTDAGKSVLATLAKNIKTPFNIIVVGHLSVAGGEPLPSGDLDLFLQPVIGFHLPL